MRLRTDIHLYPAGKEFVVINPGIKNEPSQLFPMNEAAALLWKTFQGQDFTAEAMADVLCEHYDVSHDVALNDIHQLLQTWADYRLLD